MNLTTLRRGAPAVLALLVACTSSPSPEPAWLQPGISQDLAEYRSVRIANVHYGVKLDLTRQDTAVGHVEIAFTRPVSRDVLLGFGDTQGGRLELGRDRREAGDVILDFRGLHLTNGVVNGTRLRSIDHDGAHIRIPARLVQSEKNTVSFDFTALIAPSGASITRFHDTSDGTDYLYTLLVPADANQLFPCFDQPNLKAMVRLELTVPRGWSAVANGALAAKDTTTPNVTTLRFEETKPISTYLIAFAAGPWAHVTRTVDGRPITMYVRASRAHEVEADSLINANARAAHWLETYFDVPFPFPKLDFVLAPAFPFGGMEHPGAIFYNEDQFIFREPPTPRQRKAREETIYHEVAHQWFGDLVTMRWFDDLWLKEGFATYTAAMMQAALDTSRAGSSATWKRFFLQHKPDAYEVDGTKGTVAVWQPLDNLDQAKSNYGPIVYDKAPGILKQLHYLVGDSAFRQGVHQFLVQHSYADARWPDLLDAIGTAAGRSLGDWGRQYIRRPGMPVLEQRVTVRDGKIVSVTLHQRPARDLSGAGVWPLRIQLVVADLTGTLVERPVEMRRADTTIALPKPVPAPAFVFANAGDQGYVSVSLDPQSAEWLLAHVGGLREPLLRAMGWESLWDQVRDAKLGPARYLAAVTRELPDEHDEEIVATLLGHAIRAGMAYLSCAEQGAVLPPLTTVLRKIVMDPARPYGIRKVSLNALVATVRPGDEAGAAWIEAQLGRSIPELPLGPPGRWAIVTKLVEVGAPTADQRLAEEIHRDSTTDGQRRAFVARAARPTAEAKRVFFQRYLKDTTLNEDWTTSSLRAFNAASARTLTFPYLRPALDTLPWLQQHRRIFFLGAWVGAFLDGQVSDTALRVTEQFLRSSGMPLDLKRKVMQTADELKRTVAIRRQFGAGSADCRGPMRQAPAVSGGPPAPK